MPTTDPTEEQFDNTSVISSDLLGGQEKEITLPQGEPSIETGVDFDGVNAGADHFTKALTEVDKPTEAEKDETTLMKRIKEGIGIGVEEAERGTELTKEQDILGQEKTIKDLQSTFGQIKAESAALQEQKRAALLQLQEESRGRGITKGGLAPHQSALTRQFSIKQADITSRGLLVAAELSAAQGKLSAALDFIERSVEEEFKIPRAELDAAIKRHGLLEGQLNEDQQKRADVRKAILDKQKEELEAKEQNTLDVKKIGISAMNKGADALTVRAINEAETPEEAMEIAAQAGVFDKVSTTRAEKIDEPLSASALDDMIDNFPNLDITPGMSMRDIERLQAEKFAKDNPDISDQEAADAIAENTTIPRGEALGFWKTVKLGFQDVKRRVFGNNAQAQEEKIQDLLNSF